MARAHGGRSAALAFAAAAALGGGAAGDPILDLDPTTMTSYLYAGTTAVQGVRPQAVQRGVLLDGTARAPSGFGWAVAGNPLGAGGAERWNAARTLNAVDLASGAYAPTEVDLALPAPGPRWVVGRSFNARQEDSGGAHLVSDGYQGRNWMQVSQPEIRLHAGATGDLDVLYLVYGADRFVEFRRAAAGSDSFKARNGAAGVVVRGDPVSRGEPETYTYTDQVGGTAVFFGSSGAGAAAWQLWKVADEAGNTAYVGDAASGSAAIAAGYDSAGRILKAYDAGAGGGRRFTYAYATIDGATRLAQVKAEARSGGTWASPTGVTEVGRVDYAYYQTGDNADGGNGALKLVTVTTPLSPASTSLVRKTLYRYYTGAYSGSGNPGHPYALKLVVGAEGYRRRDWEKNGALDDDVAGDSTATLGPYADAHFEYDADFRVSRAWFNGECGCSGGANGAHGFAYESSSGRAAYVANAQYDAGWATRAVVARPDGSYLTQYFDEAGQPLSSVVTDGDPAGAVPPARWVTEVVRSGWDASNRLGGLITEIRTPAANAGYAHNASGSPDGAITASAGTGLVAVFTRPTSGDARGMTTERRYRQGTSGTAYYEQDLAYATANKTVGSLTLSRPLLAAVNDYTVATSTLQQPGAFVGTTWSRTMWGLVERDITQTLPAVSAANNGSGTAATAGRYHNADGTLAFERAPDGVVSYRAYANGQLVRSIQDADTTRTGAGQDFDGVTVPAGYSSSGTPLHLRTLMGYDPQGRPDETVLPGGRVAKSSYTRLKDGRAVHLSTPGYSPGTGASASPASYRVDNLAGGAEVAATVAFVGGSTAAAMTSWVSATTGDDPVASLSTGTIARLSSAVHSPDGHKTLERRQYSQVPGSWPGASGTHYDPSTTGYDAMGRAWKTKDASGTIRRTVFDAMGRSVESWVGTNDRGFAGGEPSGTDDMTKTEARQYDGGAANGNGLVTTRTRDADGDWSTTADQRTETTAYDLRGRAIVVARPQAPHTLRKMDNLGRAVATGLYASAAGLTAASDPTALATARLALSETLYDERGRAFKTVRHRITAATGADADSIASLSWFDPAGRLVKANGEAGLVKHRYDRLGRRTHEFVLATCDDASYADVWSGGVTSVAGDVVLEERQTAYDASAGNVLLRVAIARNPGDGAAGTVGALDANADGDPLTVTATDVRGRVQLAATWYDALDRPADTVAYGTNGIVGDGATATGTFARSGLAVPARSDAALRTTSVYAADGSLLETEAPGKPGDSSGTAGTRTRYAYDAAGRRTSVISNYVDGVPGGGANGDEDRTVLYAYSRGLRTSVTAVVPGGTDQVTSFIYGTNKGTPTQMRVSTGHLLRATRYPDSTNAGSTAAAIDADSSDVDSLAYNALSEAVYRKDQAGNVVETDYDASGRPSQRRVTSLASGFDGAVRRIATTYTALGQFESVAQYDNAAIGAGTATDEVRYAYDDWGNVATLTQDPDSAVGASGRAAYSVSYAYAKAVPANAAARVRVTGISYAGGSDLVYAYSSAGGSLDDAAGRVTSVNCNAVTLASYSYAGAATPITSRLDEPNLANNYTPDQTPGPYSTLDRFDRPAKSLWWGKDKSRRFYDVDLSWDRLGNLTSAVDNVRTDGAATPARRFDVQYGMDGLSRLLRAEEGSYASGSVSGRTRDERWTLTPTGNWANHKLDLDGDGLFAGTGELDDDGAFNAANEQTGRSALGGLTLTYDAAGNQLTDGLGYRFTYDAFGRLRQIGTTSGGPLGEGVLVEEFRYNGLGRRISWLYDNQIGGGQTGDEPYPVVNGSDLSYYWVYDLRGRAVATFRAADAGPKERFVYHAPGLSGGGGYADAVVLRDRDNTSGWAAASDGTLEERRYYCQNWRADVSALATDTGTLVESVKYSAYGVPFGLPAGDVNSDGSWDAADSALISGSYAVWKDVNLDGFVGAADIAAANAVAGGYHGLGRGVLTSAAVANRAGYVGNPVDELTVSGGTQISHTRSGALGTSLGRWTFRHPVTPSSVPANPYAHGWSHAQSNEIEGNHNQACAVRPGAGRAPPLEPCNYDPVNCVTTVEETCSIWNVYVVSQVGGPHIGRPPLGCLAGGGTCLVRITTTWMKSRSCTRTILCDGSPMQVYYWSEVETYETEAAVNGSWSPQLTWMPPFTECRCCAIIGNGYGGTTQICSGDGQPIEHRGCP